MKYQLPCLLLIRTQCQDTSSKATLWMKAQIEGALTPQCIVWKSPQVPHTARQVACLPVNNSRGKQSSIPSHKTRPDSPVPTLQGPCDLSRSGAREVRRGTLMFLHPLEMRPSSIAPNPVESLEAPPSSIVSLISQRHPEKLPEVTGASQGNPGFPAATQERPRKSFIAS